MKECDNSARKIHISNFILSISLLIMFDTLLLRRGKKLFFIVSPKLLQSMRRHSATVLTVPFNTM
jgi:hypothetical protein